jgi:amidase
MIDPFSSATEIAAAIRLRRVSASDVLETVSARIKSTTRCSTRSARSTKPARRAGAREADAALARGELWGPLHGVPMTIKDALETAGVRTTGGYPPLSSHVPKKDATAVARLKAAGAVLIGKTNVPPLSADGRADNPIFGRTNNPWNLERTPGGSTGGGAAAVAAGLSAFDVGSDLAASVRVPAHWCGLFGLQAHRRARAEHRPHSRGARHAARPASHEHAGPLARSVDDLAAILKVIAGPDDRDWETAPAPLEDVPERLSLRIDSAGRPSSAGEKPSRETREAITACSPKLPGSGQVEEGEPGRVQLRRRLGNLGRGRDRERVVTQGEAGARAGREAACIARRAAGGARRGERRGGRASPTTWSR